MERRLRLISAKVIIQQPAGLHARPVTLLVREAMQHDCTITLEFNGKVGDAKSIMQVLSLGATNGQEVVVRADGPGEEEALSKIVAILESTEA
jgi:phosphocarrier protein HPr